MNTSDKTVGNRCYEIFEGIRLYFTPSQIAIKKHFSEYVANSRQRGVEIDRE